MHCKNHPKLAEIYPNKFKNPTGTKHKPTKATPPPSYIQLQTNIIQFIIPSKYGSPHARPHARASWNLSRLCWLQALRVKGRKSRPKSSSPAQKSKKVQLPSVMGQKSMSLECGSVVSPSFLCLEPPRGSFWMFFDIF